MIVEQITAKCERCGRPIGWAYKRAAGVEERYVKVGLIHLDRDAGRDFTTDCYEPVVES